MKKGLYYCTGLIPRLWAYFRSELKYTGQQDKSRRGTKLQNKMSILAFLPVICLYF